MIETAKKWPSLFGKPFPVKAIGKHKYVQEENFGDTILSVDINGIHWVHPTKNVLLHPIPFIAIENLITNGDIFELTIQKQPHQFSSPLVLFLFSL